MKSPYLLLPFIFYACLPGQPPEEPANQGETGKIPVVITDTLKRDHDTVWSIAYLMGKFNPVSDTNFVEIRPEHADRPGLYLRKETYAAFERMFEAALRDNVRLVIRSATRNFDNQKKIWENKWSGKTPLESTKRATLISDETMRAREILKYSSMPGSSRHHWGTDIDLNAFNNAFFEEGEGLKIYTWLTTHAPGFGFCQPYTEKGIHRPSGYEEEKWHWSFLPLSGAMTREVQESLRDELITGFQGAEQAIPIGIVRNYVLGIDSTCLNFGR